MTFHIAIVGAGAAGLGAAYRLHPHCAITLFERESHFGGHAWTVEVPDGPDAGLPLDLGFMVMNEQRYPRFSRVLSELDGIQLTPSEMSFSYCCRESGEEYAVNHSRAFGHMLRRPSEKSTPHTLLGEALSFGRNAKRDLLTGELGEQTLSEYLDERKIGVALRNKYILPMGAALWSAPPGQILTFPAEPYLRFLDNHGLLAISEGLSWSHVAGGSRSYVAALLRRLCNATLRSCTAVDQVLRVDDGVIVHTRTGGAERYDGVILATHADQALHLLGDADALESKLLRAIRYQSNDAVLHWDQSVMPNDPANWASWNYERESIAEPERVCVTYLLNRLQGHSNCERSYFLTLNRSAPIDERKIILRTRFTHPVFNLAAIQAQSVLSQHRVNGRVGLAGSYFGYGFHEDAMASGIAAAESMLTAQAMLEA